jgi:P4 family phage/plasmid primase-like protien
MRHVKRDHPACTAWIPCPTQAEREALIEKFKSEANCGHCKYRYLEGGYKYRCYHEVGDREDVKADRPACSIGFQHIEDYNHLYKIPYTGPEDEDVPDEEEEREIPTITHKTNAEFAKIYLYQQHEDRLAWCGVNDTWRAYDPDDNRWKDVPQETVVHIGLQEVDRLIHNEEERVADESHELDGDDYKKRFGWLYRLQNGAINTAVNLSKGYFNTPIEDFDAHKGYINCPNGTATERGYVTDKTKCAEFKLTNVTSVPYIKDGEPKMWNELLRTVQPNDKMQDYIKRQIGYWASGDNNQKLYFTWLGPNDTGKSTLLGIVMTVMGTYFGVGPTEAFLLNKNGESSRFGLAGIVNKNLVVCNEAPRGRHYDYAKIRSWIGGDVVSIDQKNKAIWSEKPRGPILFLTNFDPMIDASEVRVMKEKVSITPFENVIPIEKRDRFLQQKIVEAEGPQILDKIINEYIPLYKAHGLSEPKEAIDARIRYVNRWQPATSILTIYFEQTGDATKKLYAKEIYKVYELIWAAGGGDKNERMTKRKFYQCIEDDGYKWSIDTRTKEQYLPGWDVRRTTSLPEPPEDYDDIIVPSPIYGVAKRPAAP